MEKASPWKPGYRRRHSLLMPFSEMGTLKEEHEAGLIEGAYIQHFVTAVNSTIGMLGLLSLGNPDQTQPFLSFTSSPGRGQWVPVLETHPDTPLPQWCTELTGHWPWSRFSVIYFDIRTQVNNSAAFLLLQHVRLWQLAKGLLGLPCFQCSLTSDTHEFNSTPLIISGSGDFVE